MNKAGGWLWVEAAGHGLEEVVELLYLLMSALGMEVLRPMGDRKTQGRQWPVIW